MEKHGNLLTYISFAVVGLLLAYNTNFFSLQEIKADPVRQLDLPAVKFNPKANLAVDINLETGTSTIKSDMPIAKVDVNVDHPTKIVEKVVEKPIYKRKVIYETKTEYLTKYMMLSLQAPKLHVSSIEFPKYVER